MMLRRLLIVSLVVGMGGGVAISRWHSASAQGAVLCGVLRLPHKAAAAPAVSPTASSSIEVVKSADLPCSSLIVTEPSPSMPGSAARGTSSVNTVVHCTYFYDITLRRSVDAQLSTGRGYIEVDWSDGGSTVANVTAVGTTNGNNIALIGPVLYGRFGGGVLSLQTVNVAGHPETELEVVWP